MNDYGLIGEGATLEISICNIMNIEAIFFKRGERVLLWYSSRTFDVFLKIVLKIDYINKGSWIDPLQVGLSHIVNDRDLVYWKGREACVYCTFNH